jgi:predicted acetyltransferase
MGGIGEVATLPGARYMGYGRQALTHLLALLRDDGRTLTCLHPFRESFYGRLGYVPFPQPRKVSLAPAALSALLKKDLGGKMEISLVGDAYDAYRGYVRMMQPRVHGMAVFDFDDWLGPQRNDYWLALAKVGGDVVGSMLYDVRGERMTLFTMAVHEFWYHTSQGKYLLLAWIARHIDQAMSIDIMLPPYEYPETWLEDLQLVPKPLSVMPSPMGRVLDIAGLGGMQTGAGAFIARIKDALCPWNEGNWEFRTVDGLLTVRPSGTAECDLHIQALAGLIYGSQDPADFALRGWGNPSAQVQKTMATMFPPRLPYIFEHF